MPSLQSLFSTNSGITDAELTTYSHTTASLADDASSTYDFTIAKSALIKKVTSSVPSRLRLYSSASARTADTRDGATTTNPPEGLLIDVEFTATPDEVLFTPLEVIGNQESPLNSTIYAKIFNLSGGASTVAVTIEAYSLSQQINSANQRELLTADRTYYVRTDGNDNNDGLTNTSGGAFLTWAKALTVLSQIDGNGYTGKIIGFGTFNENIIINKTYIGFSKLVLEGDVITPSNCTISPTSGLSCIRLDTISVPVDIRGFRLTSSVSDGLSVASGTLSIIGNMDFGSIGTHHIILSGQKSQLNQKSGYTISGDSSVHIACYDDAFYNANGTAYTVTLSGTRNFSGSFVTIARKGGSLFVNITYSGSATGKRYDVTSLGLIYAVATTFPGNIAGTVSTGGQYV